MNITLSIDEETFARARDLAVQRGTSLDEMIQKYLETLVVTPAPHEVAAALRDLWKTSSGSSRGATWTRVESTGSR